MALLMAVVELHLTTTMNLRQLTPILQLAEKLWPRPMFGCLQIVEYD